MAQGKQNYYNTSLPSQGDDQEAGEGDRENDRGSEAKNAPVASLPIQRGDQEAGEGVLEDDCGAEAENAPVASLPSQEGDQEAGEGASDDQKVREVVRWDQVGLDQEHRPHC